MSNSDSDDDTPPPVFVDFHRRPEWQDVTPVPQDEGPNPVCPIAYTPQFTQTMDYFRAILNKDERSERALGLTQEVISINAANYTAWHFRRLCLEALKKDLRDEMRYVDKIAPKNPKNYQLWYHRKWLVEKLHDGSQELDFTAKSLVDDSKNYHAWAHRQWVLETFKLWANEFNYIEELLRTDPRNNSAWNQRYFVVTRTTGYMPEVCEREIQFSFQFISQAPNNQSPWNYLKGVMVSSKQPLHSFTNVKERVQNFMKSFPSCTNAVSLLLDIVQESGDSAQAKELCEKLIKSDPIHEKYWLYRLKTIA